ncbi:hypothetical protein EYF80_000888 [Liparis tanakae]|uniref:Uncharacterized protein n=1 Tax=Liparis tanakae TaxID=230148 RepID=A0A4Z2JFR1_9TELE|nr:hypothetical protein EYF80_000888 [Liparis tanakae]
MTAGVMHRLEVKTCVVSQIRVQAQLAIDKRNVWVVGTVAYLRNPALDGPRVAARPSEEPQRRVAELSSSCSSSGCRLKAAAKPHPGPSTAGYSPPEPPLQFLRDAVLPFNHQQYSVAGRLSRNVLVTGEC